MNEQLWALPHDSAEAVLSGLAHGMNAAGLSSRAPASESAYKTHQGVALIRVNGTITRTSLFNYYGQQLATGQDDIEAAIDTALADPSVSAIMLDINSPGGLVAGTKELADRIAQAAQVKPMAAYANGLMASAAMWLGAATGRVYAPVTAMVGSVGVVWVHTDWSKAFEKFGVTRSYVTAGRWKAAGNPDMPLGEAERAHFQAHVNAIHEVFRADVSKSLGITAPASQWAEGQTMLASEGKAVGLVSAIVGSLGAAIQTLRQEASMHTLTSPASVPAGEANGGAPASAQTAQTQTTQAAPGREAEAAIRADMLAMVKAMAGAEVHDKIAALINAGVTSTQLAALAPFMSNAAASVPGTTTTTEEALKAQILEGIAAATPGMVPEGQIRQPSGKSKLVADAERRAMK